jgi:predicted DNA-binding protein (MmcQ/YjbR family)
MDESLRLRGDLLEYALGVPEAWADHPWGETVVKVRKRIFVFLGTDDPERPPGMGLKLAMFHEQALSVPGAAPSGYGLGRSGWVSIPLGPDTPALDTLQDWVVESYRLVAPRRLGDRLRPPGNT